MDGYTVDKYRVVELERVGRCDWMLVHSNTVESWQAVVEELRQYPPNPDFRVRVYVADTDRVVLEY